MGATASLRVSMNFTLLSHYAFSHNEGQKPQTKFREVDRDLFLIQVAFGGVIPSAAHQSDSTARLSRRAKDRRLFRRPPRSRHLPRWPTTERRPAAGSICSSANSLLLPRPIPPDHQWPSTQRLQSKTAKGY